MRREIPNRPVCWSLPAAALTLALALAGGRPIGAAPIPTPDEGGRRTGILFGILSIEATACPDDADPAAGYQVAVELWMRDVAPAAQGYQAFLEFDDAALSYRGDLSSYTNDPFPLHIQPIATALVAPGQLRLDGSDDLGDPGSNLDALLARLVFDVVAECATTSVDFDFGQPFESELSLEGDGIATILDNTGPFKLDDTGPDVVPPADIEQNADFGECDADVTVPPLMATDNCGVVESIVNDFNGTDDASGTYPPGTTTVTWTVTDDCGNVTMAAQDVTISAVNQLALSLTLDAVIVPQITRCATLELWSCPDSAPLVIEDIELEFNFGAFNDLIEIPCGAYTCLTIRDPLHTLRRTLDAGDGFMNAGPVYVADFNAAGKPLPGGNANDDPYIDILDFGAFAGQFGTNFGSGDTACPAVPFHTDFSGDGAVGPEDYDDFIEPNFLELADPDCCGAPDIEPPRPDGPLILRLEHDPVTDPIIIGESIDVNLMIANVTAEQIAGWQAFIEYDPAELQFIGGNYNLANFGQPIIVPVMDGPGIVNAAAGIDFNAGDPPVNSDGRLITFKFIVLTDFCEPDVRFRDHFPKTRLSDLAGQQIPITLQQPPYPPTCPGDTNDDGEVDVDDLVNVIVAWDTDDCNADVSGPSPGSPPDGIVDVNDLNAVIVNWGPCP